MGFEDEVEQSFGRPCRQTNGRFKRTYELTSSIVPRGTSFHRAVELACSPVRLDPARLSCCCGSLPGPAELGAVNPDAMHDHGQPARQRHDCLLHPAVSGDLFGKAWLETELEAQLFLLDPKNWEKVSDLVRSQTEGITTRMAWFSLFGAVPPERGGSPLRDEKPFISDARVRQ